MMGCLNLIVVRKMEHRVSPWEVFNRERPEVVKAYQEMMKHVNKNNVLDKKTMTLIYVGIYSTIREGGSLGHFVNEALKAGQRRKRWKPPPCWLSLRGFPRQS